MGIILRRTKKSVWVGEARSRDRALEEFTRRAEDLDGLSVFEINDENERQLVAAAVGAGRRTDDRVDFIQVERAEVEQFGAIVSSPEHGVTEVAAVNLLHCSLDWDAATLQRFAGALFDRGIVPTEVPRAQVRAALRKIGPDGVRTEQAREFVRGVQAKPEKQN